jgi:hypothetical protein
VVPLFKVGTSSRDMFLKFGSQAKEGPRNFFGVFSGGFSMGLKKNLVVPSNPFGVLKRTYCRLF